MKATILFILYSIFIVSYVRAGASGSKSSEYKVGDIVGSKISRTVVGKAGEQLYQDKEMTYKMVKQDNVSPFPNSNILVHYTPKHEEYGDMLKKLKKELIEEKQLKVKDIVGARVPKMLDTNFNIVQSLDQTETTYKMVEQDGKSPFPTLEILEHYTPEHERYNIYAKRIETEPEETDMMPLSRSWSA